MDAYQDDLAYIHDVGYGDFARETAPGLLHILGQGGIRKGLVIDLGCGSGLWARQLVNAGYEVLGIDLSAALIDLARQRVPEGEFITQSFLEADLPPCEAVTSLGECFNYLFDERNNLSQLRQLFRRIHAALRPGGLFIFDIAEPGRGQDRQQSHRQGVDWAALVDYESDPIRQQITRRITTFRQVGAAYRRSHEVHRLQLYRGTDIANELRQMGFRVRLVRGYGQFRFPKSYVGCIARKL
jgi:SAM-dependent methyltransferase